MTWPWSGNSPSRSSCYGKARSSSRARPVRYSTTRDTSTPSDCEPASPAPAGGPPGGGAFHIVNGPGWREPRLHLYRNIPWIGSLLMQLTRRLLPGIANEVYTERMTDYPINQLSLANLIPATPGNCHIQ